MNRKLTGAGPPSAAHGDSYAHAQLARTERLLEDYVYMHVSETWCLKSRVLFYPSARSSIVVYARGGVIWRGFAL